jgi:pyruvate dehydrogenase E2 component (dihydrolipoamide acetyltransferase)
MEMAVEVLMPKLGLTMKTGTVVRWLKEVGDAVSEKEPLLEIETEKLSYQVESPAAGILLKKTAAVGEKYPIAFVVGYVGQPGEQVPDASGTAEAAPAPREKAAAAVAAAAVPAPAETGGRIFVSPVARKLAAERGIDYRQVRGTGPNGRIVKADIQRFADNRGDAGAAAKTTASDTVIPYAGIRRAIGENMFQAWSTIPMVTHHVQVDVGSLLAYREMLNEGVGDKNERISINDLLIKITAASLEKTPIINSTLTDEGIVLHKHVNMGMATALENGLIVPVIRDANKKNLLTLSREAKDLAARARSGNLSPDELMGATFTVTNLGGYGSVDSFTPIINPPQAAILGAGRVTDAAVPVGGEIKIRPLMGLSFTYDHRIIDGAVAAGFIKTLMQMMENPARSVLQ